MKQEFTFNLYFSEDADEFQNIMEETLLNYIKNIIKKGCQNDVHTV